MIPSGMPSFGNHIVFLPKSKSDISARRQMRYAPTVRDMFALRTWYRTLCVRKELSILCLDDSCDKDGHIVGVGKIFKRGG